jgi:transmembrane sensor
MSDPTLDDGASNDAYAPEVIDEASAWLALLHSPRRSPRLERGFRRWLTVRPEHQAAFEAVASMWEASGKLQLRPSPGVSQRLAGFRAGFAVAAGACASVGALVLIGVFLYLRNAGISTEIGEQRTLTLDDGSRVFMNTDTNVRVRYDDRERAVDLRRGEALFEVAKDARRPFIVSAGDRKVTALGTSFVVRRDAERVVVMLMEGKVTVTESPSAVSSAAASHPAGGDAVATHALVVGERLVLSAQRPPQVDRPSLEVLTAWRRGRLEFDDVPLAEAVAEMNRYSPLKLRVERPDAAAILVKGAFRAGDTGSFAAAMEQTCRFQIVPTSEEILLAGTPSANCL